MRKWKEKFLSRKWLISEEVAFERVMNCTYVVELKGIGKYLYKISYKWENNMSNSLGL
jgi:hypothetical protein